MLNRYLVKRLITVEEVADLVAFLFGPSAKKAVPVSEDTKTMLDRAWIKLNRSPYESFDPDEHVPQPPEDWKSKLKAFADTIIAPDPKKS